MSTPKELCQSNAAPAPVAVTAKLLHDSEGPAPATDSNNNVRPANRAGATNHPVIKPAATADKATKTAVESLLSNGDCGDVSSDPAAAVGVVDRAQTKAGRQTPQTPNGGALKAPSNAVPTNSNPSNMQGGGGATATAAPTTAAAGVVSGVLSYAQVAQRENDLGGAGDKDTVKDNIVPAGGKRKEAATVAATPKAPVTGGLRR